MSLDYYLVVPHEKWPTFDQLQAALDQDDLSITAIRPEGVSGSSPFSINTSTEAFVFLSGDMEVHAEGWLTALGEDDFQVIEEAWEPYHANEAVDFMLEMELPVKIGDRMCHVSWWNPEEGFQVWWDAWHSLVRHFDAMVYNPQAGEVSVYDRQAGAILTKPDPNSYENHSVESITELSASASEETTKNAPTFIERLRKLLGMQA